MLAKFTEIKLILYQLEPFLENKQKKMYYFQTCFVSTLLLTLLLSWNMGYSASFKFRGFYWKHTFGALKYAFLSLVTLFWTDILFQGLVNVFIVKYFYLTLAYNLRSLLQHITWEPRIKAAKTILSIAIEKLITM